jgi:hypothetical protein
MPTKRPIFYRTVYPALYFFTQLFTQTNCPWRAISFLVSLCHNHYSTGDYETDITTETKFIPVSDLIAEPGGGDGRDCEAHTV